MPIRYRFDGWVTAFETRLHAREVYGFTVEGAAEEFVYRYVNQGNPPANATDVTTVTLVGGGVEYRVRVGVRVELKLEAAAAEVQYRESGAVGVPRRGKHGDVNGGDHGTG